MSPRDDEVSALGDYHPQAEVWTLGNHQPQALSSSASGYVRFHLGGCHEDEGRVGKIICLRRLLIGQQGCPLGLPIPGKRR